MDHIKSPVSGHAPPFAPAWEEGGVKNFRKVSAGGGVRNFYFSGNGINFVGERESHNFEVKIKTA